MVAMRERTAQDDEADQYMPGGASTPGGDAAAYLSACERLLGARVTRPGPGVFPARAGPVARKAGYQAAAAALCIALTVAIRCRHSEHRYVPTDVVAVAARLHLSRYRFRDRRAINARESAPPRTIQAAHRSISQGRPIIEQSLAKDPTCVVSRRPQCRRDCRMVDVIGPVPLGLVYRCPCVADARIMISDGRIRGWNRRCGAA